MALDCYAQLRAALARLEFRQCITTVADGRAGIANFAWRTRRDVDGANAHAGIASSAGRKGRSIDGAKAHTDVARSTGRKGRSVDVANAGADGHAGIAISTGREDAASMWHTMGPTATPASQATRGARDATSMWHTLGADGHNGIGSSTIIARGANSVGPQVLRPCAFAWCAVHHRCPHSTARVVPADLLGPRPLILGVCVQEAKLDAITTGLPAFGCIEAHDLLRSGQAVPTSRARRRSWVAVALELRRSRPTPVHRITKLRKLCGL